ncbi:hypothetical protein AVEN_224117-1 [Araneus ventricosus]|uniref:Uncharacterized protein n=1 Tax=Araneus ventricosus TaxID=182803 RepID=A0A4Y2DVU5_ARAVE|nr:hypothetical protein AVEN_224117-1 [Araneus ventricosus]
MVLVILNRSHMMRATSELASTPLNFHDTPMEDIEPLTYDLNCKRSHIRRIFSGIEYRTWIPPASKPWSYHGDTSTSEVSHRKCQSHELRDIHRYGRVFCFVYLGYCRTADNSTGFRCNALSMGTFKI